jgi:hypothetical protein
VTPDRRAPARFHEHRLQLPRPFRRAPRVATRRLRVALRAPRPRVRVARVLSRALELDGDLALALEPRSRLELELVLQSPRRAKRGVALGGAVERFFIRRVESRVERAFNLVERLLRLALRGVDGVELKGVS